MPTGKWESRTMHKHLWLVYVALDYLFSVIAPALLSLTSQKMDEDIFVDLV